MTETIEQKLDRLAEFQSMKDSIESEKRALLETVKVPAEILKLQDEANIRTQEFESAQNKAIQAMRKDCAEKLAMIVIPDEIKKQITEIDIQRNIVLSYMTEKENELMQFSRTKRNEIFAETQKQTAQVYADLEQRKKDIAAEFAGKLNAVDENIKALEAEVKAEVKQSGASVKGKYLHAVYVKGRVSWNTDKIDAWCVTHPFLREARKEGEPSITIRRV